MKKALVILLSLFIVGGVFADAPTFAWAGYIESGFGMLQRDSDDDPIFGTVAPSAGVNGIRAQLQLTFTNADQNAGVRLRLRAQGEHINDVFFHQGWGWVRPFGDLIEFRAGRFVDDQLTTMDPLQDTSLFINNVGMLTYIRPLGDMLTIGLGGFGARGVGTGTPWEGTTVGEGAEATHVHGLTLWGGIGLNLDGLARIMAQFSHNDSATHALAGVRLDLLDFLPINVVARFQNLNDFSDAGRFDALAFVGINLIDNLGLNVGGAFSMSQNDAHEDPFFAVGGWATFAMGNIVPRLDLWFVSGGQYNYGQGFHSLTSVMDWGMQQTWNSDFMYFNIRPSVQFRAFTNMYWQLGAVVNINLGDANDGVDYGLFTAVRVSF